MRVCVQLYLFKEHIIKKALYVHLLLYFFLTLSRAHLYVLLDLLILTGIYIAILLFSKGCNLA